MLSSRGKRCALLGLVGALALTACMKPFKKEMTEEIGPNETAFLVALEGDSKANQARFQSEEYLNSVKVATKRVIIPQRERQLSRAWWSIEYIPMVKLIRVDRTPETRAWTKDKATGTSPRDEAIHVESQDSVGFCVGVTCTAAIEETDAAKFLYNYAGRKLEDIMDSDLRNWVQSYASQEFGKLQLQDCQKKKGEIFKTCFEEGKTYFKQFGISVRNLGYSEGMTYENPEIQKQIDEAFTAELKKKLAEQERLAKAEKNKMEIETAENEMAKQKIKNQQDFAEAQNKSQVATEFQKVAQAQEQMTNIELKKIQAETLKALAEKWGGGVPSMIIMGPGGLQQAAAQMPLIMPLNLPQPTSNSAAVTPAAPAR